MKQTHPVSNDIRLYSDSGLALIIISSECHLLPVAHCSPRQLRHSSGRFPGVRSGARTILTVHPPQNSSTFPVHCLRGTPGLPENIIDFIKYRGMTISIVLDQEEMQRHSRGCITFMESRAFSLSISHHFTAVHQEAHLPVEVQISRAQPGIKFWPRPGLVGRRMGAESTHHVAVLEVKTPHNRWRATCVLTNDGQRHRHKNENNLSPWRERGATMTTPVRLDID